MYFNFVPYIGKLNIFEVCFVVCIHCVSPADTGGHGSNGYGGYGGRGQERINGTNTLGIVATVLRLLSYLVRRTEDRPPLMHLSTVCSNRPYKVLAE
jgi:hypothetical protein